MVRFGAPVEGGWYTRKYASCAPGSTWSISVTGDRRLSEETSSRFRLSFESFPFVGLANRALFQPATSQDVPRYRSNRIGMDLQYCPEAVFGAMAGPRSVRVVLVCPPMQADRETPYNPTRYSPSRNGGTPSLDTASEGSVRSKEKHVGKSRMGQLGG